MFGEKEADLLTKPKEITISSNSVLQNGANLLCWQKLFHIWALINMWKYFVCLIAFFLISEEKTCHQSRRKVEKRLKFFLTFVIIVNMKYCITSKPYYLYYSGIYFGAMSFFWVTFHSRGNFKRSKFINDKFLKNDL